MKYRVWSLYARVLSVPLLLSVWHTHTRTSKCYCGNVCTLINEEGKEGKQEGSWTENPGRTWAKVLEWHFLCAVVEIQMIFISLLYLSLVQKSLIMRMHCSQHLHFQNGLKNTAAKLCKFILSWGTKMPLPQGRAFLRSFLGHCHLPREH